MTISQAIHRQRRNVRQAAQLVEASRVGYAELPEWDKTIRARETFEHIQERAVRRAQHTHHGTS